MKFTKMHGSGNDYIYVNGFEQIIENPGEIAIRLSDRHKGIGSDGLVMILPSETCDFRMRMFNSDGSEAEMCGNASRCVGKYVYDKGLTNKTEVTLETLAGVKALKLFVNNDNKVEKVTVDMGEPILDAKLIPTTFDESPVINRVVSFGKYTDYQVTCVSMGNPHAVQVVPDLDAAPVVEQGTLIERHTAFPQRVNAGFMQIVTRQAIRLRVFERGVGETLACGTGACAAVVAGIARGLLDSPVRVVTRGGELSIAWAGPGTPVRMCGPAVTVYSGVIDL